MAYLQRALQNYQHQHIETCTKFTNVQPWSFFVWKHATLVPSYKKKNAVNALKNKLTIHTTKTSVGFGSRIYKMS